MSELTKRVLTSVFLLPNVILIVYIADFVLLILLISVFLVCSYEIYKNSKNIIFNVTSNIILLFALFAFYKLRGNSDYEFVIILWMMITNFLSDIGGYFFGRVFKGKKLTKISPNKTISGSIGSLVLSLMSLPILFNFQIFFFDRVLIDFFSFYYLSLTLMVSIICQIGDLIVSYQKRKLKINDTGKILPGHGGMFDRIDGLIFVIIFIYLFNNTFN